MPTPTKGRRLGGSPSHERMMIANLARSLFLEGRIRTTVAKARRLRPHAERLITFAKRGDLAARREVLTVIRDKAVVHKLFAEIAPSFSDRQGGYTRILKLGPRQGDAAPMALIELVGSEVGHAHTVEAPSRRRRFGRGRSAETAASTTAAPSQEAEGSLTQGEVSHETASSEHDDAPRDAPSSEPDPFDGFSLETSDGFEEPRAEESDAGESRAPGSASPVVGDGDSSSRPGTASGAQDEA